MNRALIAVFLILLSLANAGAEGRVALVIGNAGYQHVPVLANPRNDAEAISTSLQRLGFKVISGFDLSRSGFEEKIREFAKAIRGSELALFYYAGHGLQVDGKNYLATIETQLLDEADLEFETIELNSILRHMERESRTNLVFLDACRNNPLTRNLAASMGTRSAAVGSGLAPVETGVGTLISYSTQPGNVALDGDGKNSPFTAALLRHIETPNEDIAVVLRRVRQEVIDQTSGAQVPWGNSSLTGKVVLRSANPPEVDAQLGRDPQASSIREIAFWESIKELGNVALFERYIEKYPNGDFRAIAELQIARLGSNSDARDSSSITNEGDSKVQETDQNGLRQLARSIQSELNRVGCSVGKVDGIWGGGSRKAARDFGLQTGASVASAEPNQDLLDRLKATQALVCGSSCASGSVKHRGSCVAATNLPTLNGKWGGRAPSTLKFLSGKRVQYCFRSECTIRRYAGEPGDEISFRWGNASLKFTRSGDGFDGLHIANGQRSYISMQ